MGIRIKAAEDLIISARGYDLAFEADVVYDVPGPMARELLATRDDITRVYAGEDGYDDAPEAIQ